MQNKYNIQDDEIIHQLYFTSEHVLGNEICEILNITINNISNLKSTEIMKVGSCSILNKSDMTITRKIRDTMFHPDITSLENKMCLNHFKLEYKITDEQILSTIADRIEIISGKRFICYKEEFIKQINNNDNIDNMIHICGPGEFAELKRDNVVKYYYRINSRKYIIIF